MEERKIDTCYNFDREIGCVQIDCRCEKEIIMTPTDYLKTAQKSETRSKKVEWLFTYFKSRHIKKTYNTMIEYIGFTDEQIDLEIEEYLEREMVLEGGL